MIQKYFDLKNDFSMKNNDKLAKDEEFSDKNSLMI